MGEKEKKNVFGPILGGTVGFVATGICYNILLKYIYSNANRFRQIVKIINKAENLAHANGLNSIDEILIKEVLNNDSEDKETM